MSRWFGVAVVLAATVAIASCSGGGGSARPATPTDGPAGVAAPAGQVTAAADPGLATPAGRIVGYVRDVNGRPVPGARVWLAGTSRSVRANRSGRFDLRAPRGRQTVVADAPRYTRQSVVATPRRSGGARVDFSLAMTAPDRVAVTNSADRVIMWTSCDQLIDLSAEQLRAWTQRGVDGFVCETRQLFGLGGDQRFTGDPSRLQGDEYRLQRRLAASPAARWTKDGRLAVYLAFYAVNYFNVQTPFADWFDDGGWSGRVLPRVRELAAAARSMHFAGIALDQELYPQVGGAQTASWSVRSSSGGQSEAAVRAKVKERGRQLMESMVGAFPGLELVAYDTRVPQTWDEKVAADINHQANAYADDVRVDLWNGLTSVPGYSAIRWMDAIFYKTPHLAGASWDSALEYNANSLYSYLSRRFSNWSYASSRLDISPFAWIDKGTTPFEQARPPQYVAEQLDAFRRWGTGGAFADYAYGDLGSFDYAPYLPGLQRASTAARVDRRPPELTVTAPPGARRLPAGRTVDFKGTARDDFAVRAVRWYDDRGRQGTARMTWTFSGDQRSGWNGHMDWSIDHLTVPRDARRITISAEDIHGLARQVRLPVTG